MRFATLVFALTGVLLMTGCSTLVSLHPAVTDEEATMDPAMLGVWYSADGEETYIVKQNGKAYAITYVDKTSMSKFEARLWRAGDTRFIDLVSKNDEPLQIAVHATLRVWSEAGRLRVAFLDSDWLKEQAAKQLPVQKMTGDRTVITAPSEAIRSFLVKYGSDAKAYSEPQTLLRSTI